MEQELAYSFHLGSDKNKSKLTKKVSKGNVSGTTSLSNNAIQNANDLIRLKYLKEHTKEEYTILLINGTLSTNLKVIQETTQTRVEQIIDHLKKVI